MNEWPDLELLRYLFYIRVDLLGRKLEEVLIEDHPELWRIIHSRLNSGSYFVSEEPKISYKDRCKKIDDQIDIGNWKLARKLLTELEADYPEGFNEKEY